MSQAISDILSAARAQPHTLIGFEAVEVQRFVTASRRPIAIRGASQTLCQFDERNRERQGVIFAGGARGVLLVETARARSIRDEIASQFSQLARDSAPLAIADVPFDTTREGECLAWLWLKLALARDACEPAPWSLPTDGDVCADCEERPASMPSPKSPAERICERCAAMIKAGQSDRSEDDVWSIADLSQSHRIAFVSADGNQMGRFFRSLTSLAALQAGSAAVAELFSGAHQAGLRRASKPKCIEVITGGDDSKVFLPAKAVIAYVSGLLAHFRETAPTLAVPEDSIGREALELLRSTAIGVGFVVVQDHFPFVRMVTRALEREENAKREAASRGGGSMVDFSILIASDDAEDIHPPIDADHWEQTCNLARTLGAVPDTQRYGVFAMNPDQPEESRNRFLYQVANSNEWRGWLKDNGVDWKDHDAVVAHLPSRPLLALARIAGGLP